MVDSLVWGGRPAGRLGTFETTPQAAGGNPGELYSISSPNLLAFLLADTNNIATMTIVWTEKNTGLGWGIPGQVPGGTTWKGNSRNGEMNLASAENLIYAPPTLVLTLADPQLTASPPGGSTLDLGSVLPFGQVLFDDVFGLQNTGDPNTTIAVTGYSITGADAALFDLDAFAPMTLNAGDPMSFFDILFEAQGLAPDVYGDATLVMQTSLGEVRYDLKVEVQPDPAAMIPEPGTSALLLSGVVALGLRRRRRQGRGPRVPGRGPAAYGASR